MKRARQLHGAFEAGACIVRLEPRMLAVEQRGGEHFISFGRIIIGHVADVIGNAKDFLHQHDPAAPLAARRQVLRDMQTAWPDYAILMLISPEGRVLATGAPPG